MMRTVFLFAALSFVAWTGPARAEELCIGPACIGDHHRDRDDAREERREHRERGVDREERREHRDKDRMWR